MEHGAGHPYSANNFYEDEIPFDRNVNPHPSKTIPKEIIAKKPTHHLWKPLASFLQRSTTMVAGVFKLLIHQVIFLAVFTCMYGQCL
ncbi:hypothetical protein M433DRAFT_550039 [Acidomyces richmondensis BFW]|nr:MAG: hypothetical protein FE78DRAFT_539520 [Acidomyces sp. 'richmondensis']KYG47177.1 hypothetical protein M433DRAFT_550039 [Acidomyces richmondensis BFW]